MPNHITNIITIHAETEKIKAIQEFMATKDGIELSAFDFNKLIPMPEELKDTTAGNPDNRPPEERARLIRVYGATNWYDWACAHWGTKWNAYYTKATASGFVFDTAWSTPEPIFRALSIRFADIRFTVEYADEAIGHNCGVMEYRNGAIVSEQSKEHDEHFALRVVETAPERYERNETSTEDNANAV